MAKGGKAKSKSKTQICAVGDKDCLKPDGTVVWVFCEACQGWFHCVCVNVDSKKASDDDFIFVCKCCKPQKEKVSTPDFWVWPQADNFTIIAGVQFDETRTQEANRSNHGSTPGFFHGSHR